MEKTTSNPQASYSADLAARVFREQVRLAFELLPTAILANVVLTVSVYLVLVKVVPSFELTVWTATMLLLIGLRAASVWHYRRTPAEQRDPRRYITWYFVPYVLGGLGWGLLASLMVPAGQDLFAVLMMTAVCGLAAGGVAFLGHMRELYAIYVCASVLPVAARWLVQWWQVGGDFRLVVGITALALVVLLMSAANQLSRLIVGAVSERLEKDALAARLQDLVATVERANQAKSDFIASMSQRVHGPTQAIVDQARTLLAAGEATPGAAQREELQGLHDDANALLDMLGDVLDYSSLEAGQLQIERVEFDVRELIARAVNAGARHAGAKGLGFDSEVAADLPARLVGDPRRLMQILANLLSNAVKFSASGSVRLEVRQVSSAGQRHTLSFAVRDTGVGIPARRLGEVFAPFNHQPGAAADAGSGLGLAICRRLAGLMQGAIAVESLPGRGSVFTLVLALSDPAAEP